MDSSKQTAVKFSTFQSWNLTCIGYNTYEDVSYISKVWCKICAANKGKLYQHHAVKGATEEAAERFVDGTEFVTKHLVWFFTLIDIRFLGII